MTDDALARRFTADTLAGIKAAHTKTGYYAHDYHRMVCRYTAVGAAKHVLRPGPPASGFVTLMLAGRPDLTTEALAVRPEYETLFTEAELATAAERLDWTRHGRRPA